MNIKVRQEEIIEEFGLLDGDLEMSINYLIELGDQLAPFPVKSIKMMILLSKDVSQRFGYLHKKKINE